MKTIKKFENFTSLPSLLEVIELTEYILQDLKEVNEYLKYECLFNNTPVDIIDESRFYEAIHTIIIILKFEDDSKDVAKVTGWVDIMKNLFNVYKKIGIKNVPEEIDMSWKISPLYNPNDFSRTVRIYKHFTIIT